MFFCENVETRLKIGIEIFARALDIEFGLDWSVGLGDTLGECQHRKLKKHFFSISGIFPGRADSVTLVCFECSRPINPQNLIKLVGTIFEKIEISKCFLMLTTLNFKGRSKTEIRLEIFARGP